MEILLLRLDAPMMSFGSVLIDNLGRTSPFPGKSMLTGLLANALGYQRSEHERLEGLQDRLRHSVRREREGQVLLDYQTVELGQEFLRSDRAWTSWGTLDVRAGQSSEATHERFRYYLAGAAFTVAISLQGPGPSVHEVGLALEQPKRPLFLGRKSCPPASPIFLGITQADSLREAILGAPGLGEGPRTLWWPEGDSPEHEKHPIYLCDIRDWRNQIHVGRSCMFEEQP